MRRASRHVHGYPLRPPQELHLDLIREAASQNDLYAQLESLMGKTPEELDRKVSSVWADVRQAIRTHTASIDNPYVEIWSGDGYLWDVIYRFFARVSLPAHR